MGLNILAIGLVLAAGTVKSNVIPISEPFYSEGLVKCVTSIVTRYFSTQTLTYVGNKQDDEEFLKAIHDLNSAAVMSRRSSRKLPVTHQSYFISSKNTSVFRTRFPFLTRETTWNPDAYFMIVVRDLQNYNIEEVFDTLLQQHVTNVIVINATADAHLYSYNPFENYGCGKRYDNINNYAECSKMYKYELFPYKYQTKLQNCNLVVSIPDSPPFTVLPSNDSDNSSPLHFGVEPYLLRLVGEMNNFTINVVFKHGPETFSTISPDMEADGPLKMLQTQEADIILGGLFLTPSRAVAFEYVYDLLPYIDEIRFVVKRAEFVQSWKNFYLEFDGTVWMLILFSLIFYSSLMITLLRLEDKSLVVYKLLDNLVLHGCNMPCHSTVKYIFIIWVWFAYLINTFYQSSLVSLTSKPAMETQISKENDIAQHKLKPCFSETMDKYYMESTQSNYSTFSVCQGQEAEVLQKVINSKEYYSLTLYGSYEYEIQHFYDVYGNPQLYLFKQPYSKVIYSMFIYKGFPFVSDISLSALRLREMGLVEKAMSDMNYAQSLKHHFRGNNNRLPFVVPWHIYIFGCILAVVTFIVEILSREIRN